MVVDCPQCQAIVDAKEVSSCFITDEVAPNVRVKLSQCPKCQQPFLTHEFEDFDGWTSPAQIYPPLEYHLSASLPEGIRDAYLEARKCFRARAYTAAAIMCRKTLEGICAEHGYQERNLAASLKAMRDAGQIENRLYEWADALRISGNEAAHGVALTVSAQDASDILDFTNALTEYVFTFRDRFEQFKARRAARSTPADAGSRE